MAPVQGRVSSYVSIENGAASPGRWQVWQFFCRIGATSFVNVGAFILPICEQRCAVEHTANSKPTDVRFIASRPLQRLEFPSSQPAQRSYQEFPHIPGHSQSCCRRKCRLPTLQRFPSTDTLRNPTQQNVFIGGPWKE